MGKERRRRYTAEGLEPRLMLSMQTGDTPLSPGPGSPVSGTIARSDLPRTADVVLLKLKDANGALSTKAPLKLASGQVLSASIPRTLGTALASLKVQSMKPAFTAAALNLTAAHMPRNVTVKAELTLMQAQKAELSRWYRLELPAGADVAAAVATLSAGADVQAAEPEYQFKLDDTIGYPISGIPDSTTDPAYDEEWYLNYTNAQKGWNFLKENGVHPGGSPDVVVAVVDSGVDYTHPDLAGNIWTNPGEIPGNNIDDDQDGFVDDVHGASVVSDARSHAGDPTDLFGHGTHVAGTIAGQGYNHVGGVGVAFNVKIVPIRASQYSGALTSQDIAEGVMYAFDHGAEVINMSFGGYGRSQVVEDALKVALNQAVLVAAAGNDGLDGHVQPQYPAALPYVHGVMALTAKGKLAWFSNSGYDMAAPGEGIYSTLPGGQYARWSGTSMAAPMVSAAAALLRSFYWQRDVYSSRFLMGAIMGGEWAGGGALDVYKALTTLPTPGVSVLGTYLFDTANISPANDGDGRADSGETLHLAVELINRSGQADNVTVTVRAHANGAVVDDPYVTITTPTVNFGSIGPFNTTDSGFIRDAQGVISGAQRPFVFTLAPDTPNDHVIPFEITTTFHDGWNPAGGDYTRVSRVNYIVQRGRNLPSVIGADMTLTADQYWIVGGPVLIQPGATLTIAAGTQVQWGAVSSDPYNPGPQSGYLVVRGGLEIAGTAQAPVNLFPSYLVAGQTVKIDVDGGTANMRYVTVTNPELRGLRNVDHADFRWDHYTAVVQAAWVARSAFHHFPAGSTISASLGFDTVLFDACNVSPVVNRIHDSAILPNWENDRPQSIGVPSAFCPPCRPTRGRTPAGCSSTRRRSAATRTSGCRSTRGRCGWPRPWPGITAGTSRRSATRPRRTRSTPTSRRSAGRRARRTGSTSSSA